MHHRPATFCAVVVLLLSAIPFRAQIRRPGNETVPRTYYIRGSVRNSDSGHPMEMVKVDLKRITGEVVGTTFTRSNGEFEFNGLPNGVYYLILEEKDYEPIRESVEIVNSPRPGVYLFLKRPLEIRATARGNVVSARELSIPRKAHEAMEKGLARLEKSDFKGSLAHFQRAIAELPSYYEAYHQMGVAQMQLGQSSEAEQAFRKAIELSEGRYPDAHFALAALLSTNQRFAEAEPLARHGVELSANAWLGHYELARALLGLNRLDDAEKSAQEARTRNSNFPVVHLLLANIHIRKQDFRALLGDLNTYLVLEPNGAMSEQARQAREKVQRALANTESPPGQEPVKP